MRRRKPGARRGSSSRSRWRHDGDRLLRRPVRKGRAGDLPRFRAPPSRVSAGGIKGLRTSIPRAEAFVPSCHSCRQFDLELPRVARDEKGLAFDQRGQQPANLRRPLQHASACQDCEPSRILRRSTTWEGSMIFVYRAAIVAVATFVSALAGFGVHWVLPAAYVVESKGMIGSVVGLRRVASVACAEPLDLDEPRPAHRPGIRIADDRQFDHPPRLRAQSLWPRGGARARAPARACQAHTRAPVVQPQ